MKKPTIAELEEMLSDPSYAEVSLNPDGSVTATQFPRPSPERRAVLEHWLRYPCRWCFPDEKLSMHADFTFSTSGCANCAVRETVRELLKATRI